MKSYIDLTETYGFVIYGQINIESPEFGSVVNSYYSYAHNYHWQTKMYSKVMKRLIDKQNLALLQYKKLPNDANRKILSATHKNVAMHIFSLRSYYANACLASELYMKACITLKSRYESLEVANRELKNKYGHNLNKLAKDSCSLLDLNSSEISMISKLNKMYSGIKRFQYPHKFLEEASPIPPLEFIVKLNSKIDTKIIRIIDKQLQQESH